MVAWNRRGLRIRRGRGFTLIELLVAVAVIAVLIAILVPSLGYAREQAKRAACLGRMKQMGALYLAYANDSKDQIPMGYADTTKQFNYVVNVNDQGSGGWKIYWSLMAPLYLGGYITDGNVKAFYCPSNLYPAHTFNYRDGTDNDDPWPPIRTTIGHKCTTRFGYGCRPAFGIDWSEPTQPDPTAGGNVYKMKWPGRMPQISEMKTFAIVADIVSSPERVNKVHRKGVNALYGDASARWVDRKFFDSDLNHIPVPEVGFQSSYNDYILNDSDANPGRWSGVWAQLDRH